MEPQNQRSHQFEFPEPRQIRIYERLNRIGPGPAAFFRDACFLIANAETVGLESTSHLVGHLAREIEDSIREVLLPLADRSQKADTQSADSDRIKPQIRAILELLEFSESDPITSLWFHLKGREEQDALHKRAHRRNLEAPRPADQQFITWWSDFQTFLDSILERFESHHLRVIELLDRLLSKQSPTNDDIKTLKQRVPHNLITYGYFFDRLQSPAWLEPLRRADFFLQPPDPIEDKDKGTIAFPIWPQSRYLARIAASGSEQVCDAILEIPDTSNQHVHGDFADAASKMPARLTARWVQKEIEWLKGQQHLFLQLPEKLGNLISHLANEGETTDLAITLARELLWVLPRDGQGANRSLPLSDEPRARFWTYNYERILQNNIPPLFRARPNEVFTLFCVLLDEAIRLSTSRDAATLRQDGSYIWRQAIEGGGRRHEDDVRDLLVSAVRDMAEKIAAADSAIVPTLSVELESYRWTICRLALHILRLYPNQSQELITKQLTDKENFESTNLWHEYFLLLKERFSFLPEPAKATILSWIEAGPEFDKLRSDAFRDEEERQSYKRSWQLRHLIPINENLPPKWKMFYQQLLDQQGEPEHPEFMFWTGEARWGLLSPKNAEELKTMSVAEVITFLRTWEPALNQFDSTPEGLGKELEKVVLSDPTRFTAELEQFRGLDPTYIRSLVSGFHERIKQKQPIEYRPVLDLCRWVIGQPKEIPGRKIYSIDQDPNWGWTRSAIARLLDAGLEAGEREIAFDLRTPVWQIIEALTRDPEPTDQDEKKYGGSNMDPSTLSLNTVRGEAMHSVIRYALWVRRHLEVDGHGKEHLGFNAMPEVSQVLDEHLEPTHEPSEAIRSVYGQWLPTLAFLDRSWVEKNKERIFPKEAALTHLRETAWDSFITFSQPLWSTFDLLAEEYQYAISQLGLTRPMRSHLGDPNAHLVNHLMVFYWTGKLVLDTDGLVGQFFRQAPPELRGHAINFVGNSLYHTKDKVPDEVLERLKNLWESRIDQINHSEQREPFRAELEAFGWWFASAKFDPKWSISQLRSVFELNDMVEPDHLVVEQLDAMATEFPQLAIECLDKIIESDKDGWKFYAWNENSMSILSTALRSNSNQAQQSARHLINKLSARGYLDYRDLLRE